MSRRGKTGALPSRNFRRNIALQAQNKAIRHYESHNRVLINGRIFIMYISTKFINSKIKIIIIICSNYFNKIINNLFKTVMNKTATMFSSD